MELSSYERDFENAKALKTLQENTDPENLVAATKRKIEQAESYVAPESPNRPSLGALTIAQAQCNVTISADLYFKQTRQTLARHSVSSVSPASWIEHCAQQGTSAVGFRVMSLHASVPHCTILGASLMATLSEKKAKKQRAQKHVLQDAEVRNAKTGTAALELANRDPSLTALMARATAIQKLMRQLKTVMYWTLVLDPQSFSSTVENMFAVAIIMDLALIQIVEDEDSGVAIVNWEFNEDSKEVDDEVLMSRIGDQGLNEEEAFAQDLEQAASRPAQPISTSCISITAKQWRELCDVLEIEHAIVQLSKD